MSDIDSLLRWIFDIYQRIPELTPDQLILLTAYLKTLPPVPPSRTLVIGTSSAAEVRLLPAAIPDPAATERLRRQHLQTVRLTNKRRLAALRTPQGNPTEHEPSIELPDLVDLDQAAAVVNRKPAALRHYRDRGMPKPHVRGKKGQPNEYLWSEMRPWLEKTFNRSIPVTEIRKFRVPEEK
jgi:hypothetical protein